MEPNSLEWTVVTISFMRLAHFGHSTSLGFFGGIPSLLQVTFGY